MARFLTYTFPAGNTTDVCTLQNLAAAGNLFLNGNLANQVNDNVNFLKYGYSRQLSLTSANNLSARTFTITGMQNGVSITENIGGPNNDTVYGTLVYDVITSISVDGAVNGVSVGTGWQGFFPLIGINLERDVINYTLTLAQAATGNIPYSIYGTLSNIVNNGNTYLLNVANNHNLISIQAFETENNYVYSSYGHPIYSSLIIFLGQDNTSITYSTQMNFIQI